MLNHLTAKIPAFCKPTPKQVPGSQGHHGYKMGALPSVCKPTMPGDAYVGNGVRHENVRPGGPYKLDESFFKQPHTAR